MKCHKNGKNAKARQVSEDAKKDNEQPAAHPSSKDPAPMMYAIYAPAFYFAVRGPAFPSRDTISASLCNTSTQVFMHAD